MGNRGTFKPLCKRGHERAGNIDASGHCLTCGRGKKIDLTGPTATGVFKPFCVRGHSRAENAKASGHCKICEKESLAYRVYQRNRAWKLIGIINQDGAPFTIQDYNRAFQIQGGLCRGCRRHQTEFKKALIADHDHATGLFRGLLCFQCNFILGNARDEVGILESLVEYLKGVK